jgi:hypothetical protein
MIHKSGIVYFQVKKIFLAVFILLIPFYDIPRTIRSGLTVDFFYAFLLAPFCLKGLYHAYKENRITIFLFFCFFLYLCTVTILYFNEAVIDIRGINHLVFYLITFFLYFFFIYAIYYEVGRTFFKKILRIAVVIVFLIGLVEMFVFFTQGWHAYANFLNHENNVGIFSGLPRMRSTFNEPSHLVLFLGGVAPIVLEGASLLFKILFILCFISTFSTSATVGIFIAAMVFFLIKLIKQKIKRNVFFAMFFVIIFLLFIAPRQLWEKLYNISTIDTARYSAFIETITYLFRNPFHFIFGSGATSYYQVVSSGLGLFNWYLQLIIEVGIEGFCIFLMFLLYASKFFRLTDLQLFWLLVILFQFIGMNHYYIPGFWMLLAWINFKFHWKYK